MNKKVQNGFFIFGLIVLGVMVSQLNFKEVWAGLQHAGYWFAAVVALWAALYVFNTSAWYVIIRSQEGSRRGEIRFWWLYKLTISGFAINYATPGGLMGGEPYRVMALKPKIGTERATASVVLYAMTHIFSHLWFWLLSAGLYVLFRPVNFALGVMLAAVAAFCLVAIWFFLAGYRKGLAVSGMKLFSHLPGLHRRVSLFIDRHKEQLEQIDKEIADLHNQNPRTFLLSVLLELSCRFCSGLEVMFVLLVLYPSVNYLDCIFIIAFTTLFANMLFFIPLQLGGREGGFLMSVTAMGLTASAGIFVALIVRLRELIWTAIGLLLIKTDRASNNDKKPDK